VKTTRENGLIGGFHLASPTLLRSDLSLPSLLLDSSSEPMTASLALSTSPLSSSRSLSGWSPRSRLCGVACCASSVREGLSPVLLLSSSSLLISSTSSLACYLPRRSPKGSVPDGGSDAAPSVGLTEPPEHLAVYRGAPSRTRPSSPRSLATNSSTPMASLLVSENWAASAAQ
jgi:hypothetical protein